MIILGIESAALTASAAIITDDILTAEYTVNHKKTHSQTLLPMLDEIVQMAELDRRDIDAIAVSAGPGSFTGLRIGAATAKGLALALGKPLIAVPTLEALAFNLFGADALICPVMDARRNQVYNGLYYTCGFMTKYRSDPESFRLRPVSGQAGEERLSAGETGEKELTGVETVVPSRAIPVPELLAELNERGERVIFLGDGVSVLREAAEETLTVPFDFAPPSLNRMRAASVAALGARMYRFGMTTDAANFAPDYLRKSQAEREYEEAKAAGKLEDLAAGIAPK